MIEWGINALNHDASIAVFVDKKLEFHRRSSEYSGIIGDSDLNSDIIDNALRLGLPSKIYWYERPIIKKLRQLYAGQYRLAFDIDEMPKRYLDQWLSEYSIVYNDHHLSHAAAGYYTSPFQEAAVVVIDAIGEWTSMSIWLGKDDRLTCLWEDNYPKSLGLFYSAFTQLIGLKATKEEHLLQQMSSKGDPSRFASLVESYLDKNLHRGVTSWPMLVDSDRDRQDIAAAVQQVFEQQVDKIMARAKMMTERTNLVYMGGCAMNSQYNQRLANEWDKVWSLPWPGDASSSVGAWCAKNRARVDYPNKVVKHLTIRV